MTEHSQKDGFVRMDLSGVYFFMKNFVTRVKKVSKKVNIRVIRKIKGAYDKSTLGPKSCLTKIN